MTNQTETKRQSAVEASVVRDEQGVAKGLVLTFANGRTLTAYDDDLSHAMSCESKWHGFKQKVADATAISRDAKTGRSATVQDKYEAAKEVFDRVVGGTWNAIREGGGGSGTLLFKALCRYMPNKTPDELKTWLDAKTDAEKTALRLNPKLAAIILTIQAEAAKVEGIDDEALLAQLN